MGSKLWGYAALLAGIALAGVTAGASLELIALSTAKTFAPWLAGAAIGLNLVAGNVAARDARKAANASLQDRVTTIRSTDEPRAILYGRQRVGGVLTYVSPPFGSRKERVTLVITLVGHPCDAVEQIWIDDEPVTIDANGTVTGGINTGKWATKVTDMTTVSTTGPAVWDAGSPTSNRILSPSGATGVVSVMYVQAAGDIAQRAVPGVDYVVLSGGGFHIGVLNGALTGADLTITYSGYWLLDGSITVRTWTGRETGAARQDTDLQTNSGGAWASTATGDGICRMHVTMAYNETMFADGVPSFSAVVRGRRVYDPRLDSTNGGAGSHRYTDESTWAWTRNPALCARDYLTWSWGFGVEHTRIDDALVRAAAASCDVQMRVHPTDPTFTDYQFTVDGFLSTSQSPPDNLDEICAAMGGFAAPSGSTWRIMAGAWTAPAADATLGDSHVVGEAEFTTLQDAGDLFNSVRGRYRDEATWQTTEFPVYSSSTYVTEDGGEAWRDIDLPLTLNQFRAQRVAKLLLFRARQSLTFSATFTLAAWRFQPGDRLRLLLTEYGWDTVSQDSGTGKVFRVLDRQWVFPDQVRLVLQEDTATIYDWLFSEAVAGDPTPNTTLPSASVVAAPVDLEGSASSSDFIVAPDGVQIGFVKFTWDAITDSGVLAGGWLELRWKRAEEPSSAFRILRVSPFSVEYRLEGLRADELLNVGILAVNASQARSSLTLIEGNVTPDLANGLFSVQTAFLTGSGGTVWSGNHAPNADYRHGTSGWSLFLIASPSYSIIASQPGITSAVRLNGPPSWNVQIDEQGAGAVSSSALVAGWSQTVPITAVPGERYGVRALVELDGCDAVVAIAFYRADGSFIAGSLTFGALLTKTYTGASNKASYVAGTAYGTAPAGSAGVRGLVYKYGTKAPATTSRVWVLEPDVRELVGADAMPGWAVGAPGPQSRSIVLPYSDAGTAFTTTNQIFVDHVLGTFVAEAAGTVDIRVVCEVVAKAAAGYTNNLDVGIFQTSKRALISRRVLTVSGGTDVPQSVSIEASMTCVAGESIAPLLRLSRSHYGVGANYNATDKVRKVEATYNVVYD